MRVRVIEDSHLTAVAYASVLERAGHRVDIVSSKFERQLNKSVWQGVDCAIVDHRLSARVTGASILNYLSANLPHVRRVAISGSEGKELSGQMAHVILQKPVTPEQIIEAVENL